MVIGSSAGMLRFLVVWLRKFVVSDVFLFPYSDGQWLQLLMDGEYQLQCAMLDHLSEL